MTVKFHGAGFIGHCQWQCGVLKGTVSDNGPIEKVQSSAVKLHGARLIGH